MMKRVLLYLTLMVMVVVTTNAGTWKMHNAYMTSKIQNVYDLGDKVYYLNCGELYQFDKDTNKTVWLNCQNKLSSNLISQLYYDWENNLLFVAYLDCNLDIIDADGNVYNVSNIKDALFCVRNPVYNSEDGNLAGYSKNAINDITFAHGIAYVTVNYGYLTLDEATKRITSNMDLSIRYPNTNINSVAVIGNTMAILTNINCYYGPVGSEDPFGEYARKSGSFTGARMFPINETSLFVLSSTALYNYDFTNGAPVLSGLVSSAPTSVQKAPTGFIANFAGKNFYYTIDETGKVATQVATSSTQFATSYPLGDGTVWINDATGLHMKNSAESYKLNALTTDEPYWLKYNAAMDKLYVASTALNGKNRAMPNNYAIHVINTYNGEIWENATAFSANGAAYEFVFDPFDPFTYVRASWSSGIFKVTNDVKVNNYTKSNTGSKIGTYKAHPAFDKNGNMWVVNPFDESCPWTAVLPRARFVRNNTTTGWFVPSAFTSLKVNSFQRSRFLISKKNNMKIFCDCDYVDPSKNMQGYIRCFDNGNEDPTVDEYRLVNISCFVDQNSKQVKWNYLLHLEEDNDGMIWAGYMGGLFVFDPENVFDDYPRAIRPFVTKFDEGPGTLCEGYDVYDVGVTRDNKKWIATNYGVYYVSPDGSEVYNHFTTDNSDIPSDVVYSVECDTIHDRVYIFTDIGLAEYVATGETASLNFDETYAFPNPVEPDFTGMVKIAKLMEDSFVTITDRNGQVVAQLGPVMGGAYWDCSGPDGNRVPTGVYNVYAAQGRQPSTTGTPQTTIMVIR